MTDIQRALPGSGEDQTPCGPAVSLHLNQLLSQCCVHGIKVVHLEVHGSCITCTQFQCVLVDAEPAHQVCRLVSIV